MQCHVAALTTINSEKISARTATDALGAGILDRFAEEARVPLQLYQ
jgi:hypothetical protein